MGRFPETPQHESVDARVRETHRQKVLQKVRLQFRIRHRRVELGNQNLQPEASPAVQLRQQPLRRRQQFAEMPLDPHTVDRGVVVDQVPQRLGEVFLVPGREPAADQPRIIVVIQFDVRHRLAGRSKPTHHRLVTHRVGQIAVIEHLVQDVPIPDHSVSNPRHLPDVRVDRPLQHRRPVQRLDGPIGQVTLARPNQHVAPGRDVLFVQPPQPPTDAIMVERPGVPKPPLQRVFDGRGVEIFRQRLAISIAVIALLGQSFHRHRGPEIEGVLNQANADVLIRHRSPAIGLQDERRIGASQFVDPLGRRLPPPRVA